MADLTIKAGDTEPITFTIDVTGVDNLDEVTSAALYAREQSADTNHVDGATLTVSDSANKEMSFDPEGSKSGGGDAFGTDDDGDYKVYVLVTWSDGDTTRHPGEDYRYWEIQPNFEA